MNPHILATLLKVLNKQTEPQFKRKIFWKQLLVKFQISRQDPALACLT